MSACEPKVVLGKKQSEEKSDAREPEAEVTSSLAELDPHLCAIGLGTGNRDEHLAIGLHVAGHVTHDGEGGRHRGPVGADRRKNAGGGGDIPAVADAERPNAARARRGHQGGRLYGDALSIVGQIVTGQQVAKASIPKVQNARHVQRLNWTKLRGNLSGSTLVSLQGLQQCHEAGGMKS